VALVWAYKDCILEGNQDKEDVKRQEIFFNEVLAQDEIDRLLDPKVLVNWTRHTPNGPEKVASLKRDDNGTIKENLLIKGNNLLALHTLKKQFTGKVKLIYIDPPYNTGNDGFKYNDRFNHSTWLTFMKNRLEVARELLREDGVVFINIDDDESHYLKVLSDDIYGRDNFIVNVVWQKKYTIANDAKYFSDNHDHILVFAKDKQQLILNRFERSEKMDKAYSNPDKHPKGVWKATPLHAKSGVNTNEYIFKNGIHWRPPKGTFRRFSDTAMRALEDNNEIWFGVDGNATPSKKTFLTDLKNKGVVPNTIWTFDDFGHNHEANTEFSNLQLKSGFGTPKPEKLLQNIVQLATNENDLVLDFFGGSGTTGAVAHKMNRQWILVEQMNYIKDLPEARLIKVLEGEQGGISNAVNWQGGGDFIYCELAKYNEKFKDLIRDVTTTDELLKIWIEMKEKAFLDYRVETVKFDTEVFKKLNFEEQKNILADVLDKNQLYVNYTEMEDVTYNISQEDKDLTNKFYKR
jgi:adenine-specific DNA-methyltransferase